MQPVDIASLAMFRIVFGTLMCGSTLRFMASGWVRMLFEEPKFFFKYWGFAWVQPWQHWGAPSWSMQAHYAALAVLAFCVAVGLFYRLAIVLFLLGFAYAQLIDLTNYLNHYYLVLLLSLLLCFMPAADAWSIDAWRKPLRRRRTAPGWCLLLLRFQIAVVYCNAGLAKLGSDWLLHAQPVRIWMLARNETAVIGPWLGELWVAYALSWFGFLFDLSIAFWLMWRRSRPWAYAVVLVFHFFTWVFFDIGMFPFIMSTAALVFFPADWPRRLAQRLTSWRQPANATLQQDVPVRQDVAVVSPATPASDPSPTWGYTSTLGWSVAAVYCVVQLLLPLRHYAYPGNVLWNEEGMRYAWKVLVREKNGSITYLARAKRSGRVWQVNPRRYLTWRQHKELWGQPDLIVQLAKRIAIDLERRGVGAVEVRVLAKVSLNGRPPALMIDPTVDLAQVDENLWPKSYILPAPQQAPPQLRRAI